MSYPSTRSGLHLALLCALICSAGRAGAATVQLENLPVEPYVYLDGKPVVPIKGRISLPPGLHELQVESYRPGFSLFHQWLKDDSNALIPVNVKPLRVIVPYQWSSVYISSGFPGPSGPVGSEGAVADETYKILAGDELLGLAKAGLNTIVDDLSQKYTEVAVQQYVAQRFETAKTLLAYEYDPARQFPVLPYLAGNSPAGPPGPPGPPGPAGLPGNLFLLQDENGVPILDVLKEKLGVGDLNHALKNAKEHTAVKRNEALTVSNANGEEKLVGARKIFNPEVKLRLNLLYHKTLAEGPPFVCVPGPVGPSGPLGPRGKDGVVPDNAQFTPRRLSAEQVRQLVALCEDKDIVKRLDGLKARLADLTDKADDTP